MFKRLCHRSNDNNVIENSNEERESVTETTSGAEQFNDTIEEPSAKKARFKLGVDAQDATWDLPTGLLDYIHKYMSSHISDKDIKENILSENPVPSNLKKIPELDSYIKVLLQDNSKYAALKSEKSFKAVHEKIHNVFGPLSRIWAVIDEERDRNPNDEPLQEMSSLFEQTILLLSQACNSVAYYRRENILSTLIDSNAKVKDIIKQQSKDLDKASNEHLFGEDFEQKLIKDSKALKKSESVFTALKSSRASGSSTNSRPFPKGPVSLGRGRGQSGYKFPPTNNWKFSNIQRGKENYSSISAKCVKPYVSLKSSPSDKKSVSTKVDSESNASRPTKVLLSKLEGIDTGPYNFTVCSRISDPISINTSPVSCSLFVKSDNRGKDVSRTGSENHDVKRGYKRGDNSVSRPIFKFNIFGSKKGWGEQTSDQFEKSEQTYTLPSFQNGESVSAQRVDKKRRLHVQIRSEGRLFFGSIAPKFSKVCKFPMGTKDISVSMPVLWSWSGTKNFYKTDESSNCSAKTSQHSINNLFGRLSNTSSFNTRGRDGQGYADIYTSASRILSKFSKVSTGTNTCGSVSRGSCRFNSFEVESASGKNRSDNRAMSMSVVSAKSFGERPNEIDRSSFFNSNCNSSSASTIQGHATSTNSGAFFQQELRFCSSLVRGSEKRTQLVVPESSAVEWSLSNIISSTVNNRVRCIPSGLGGILQRSQDRGTVVNPRKGVSYKHIGIEDSKVSNCFLSSIIPNNNVYSHSNGQYCGIDLLNQDGWYKKQNFDFCQQRDLEVFTRSSDHDYC